MWFYEGVGVYSDPLVLDLPTATFVSTGLKWAIIMKNWLLVCLTLIYSAAAMALEEPKFKVVQSFDGNIEIREYEPYLVAVTKMDGSPNAGFRVLASYIFGGNETEQEIAMTAPVSTTMTAESPEMTFMIPSEYALEALPKPSDNRVKFRAVPAYTAAVIRFSGRANADNVAEHWQELRAFLAGSEWRGIGEPTLNQYNPPWTLGFWRRNEIIMPVMKK